MITYPITKEQLKRYRDLKLELVNQTERLERLRASLVSCGASVLSDEPKSGGSGANKLPDGISNLIELEAAYQEQVDRLNAATVRIEQAIQKLAEPYEREVLRLRYIDGLKWHDIQYAVHYERTEVFRLHSRAIASLYKVGTIWD